MKVEGRILYIMDVKSGVSKNGKNWKTVDFVVEIPGQYPKKVCFNLFGEERVATFCGTCNVQDEVVVDFEIDAQEYLGKWYNKVSAWKVRLRPRTRRAEEIATTTRSNVIPLLI